MIEGRLFVLQVWPEPGRFRAELRAVDETEVARFEAVRPLCEHLAGIALTATTPGGDESREIHASGAEDRLAARKP